MPTGRPGRVFWRIRAGVFEGLEGFRRLCRPGRIRACVGIIIMIYCFGGFAAGADVSRPTPRLNTARKEEKVYLLLDFAQCQVLPCFRPHQINPNQCSSLRLVDQCSSSRISLA